MSALFSQNTKVLSGLSEQAVAQVLRDELGLLERNAPLEVFTLLLQHNARLTIREIDEMGRRDVKEEFLGSLKYLGLVCREEGCFKLTPRAESCLAGILNGSD